MSAEAIKAASPATEVFKVVTGLSFWQQVGATLIGVVAGFAFSLFLIWIKHHIQKRILTKNLHKEINYNSEYLTDLKKRISKTSDDIDKGHPITHMTFNFNFFAKTFLSSYLNQGYLFEVLETHEIVNFSQVLLQISESTHDSLHKLFKICIGNPHDAVARQTLVKDLVFAESIVTIAIDLNKTLKEKL